VQSGVILHAGLCSACSAWLLVKVPLGMAHTCVFHPLLSPLFRFSCSGGATTPATRRTDCTGLACGHCRAFPPFSRWGRIRLVTDLCISYVLLVGNCSGIPDVRLN